MGSVTVGLDIGTTSIKAVAVDDAGVVLSRIRLPHQVLTPSADRMEHDAGRAWRRDPRRALRALAGHADVAAVGVAAMVPSLAAVDRQGRPITAGLLYGDGRGRSATADSYGNPGFGEAARNGEICGFLSWSAAEAPDAYGYWPAQSVAIRALGGAPAIDLAVAFTYLPLYGDSGWDAEVSARAGVRVDQLPPAEMPGTAVGRVDGDGPVLTAGTVDVWCEQMVAGADQPGDVHVICGTTLIIWADVPVHPDPPNDGLWRVDHGVAGRRLVGGASNAGGLFLDWVNRTFPATGRGDGRVVDPADIPVWTPYPRGERTPYHDPDRRAGLHDLNLTHGPAAIRRAAYEASGFVVRHHLDRAGVTARRVVATGGGTKVDAWMQALADSTGMDVHAAAEPEGAARGAAYLARVAAGIDRDWSEAGRWASTRRVFPPDPRWELEAGQRYQRFRDLSG